MDIHSHGANGGGSDEDSLIPNTGMADHTISDNPQQVRAKVKMMESLIAEQKGENTKTFHRVKIETLKTEIESLKAEVDFQKEKAEKNAEEAENSWRQQVETLKAEVILLLEKAEKKAQEEHNAEIIWGEQVETLTAEVDLLFEKLFQERTSHRETHKLLAKEQNAEILTRGEYNDLRAKVAAESSLAANAEAVAIVMPDTEPLNLNPFQKFERTLQKTGTWLVQHIFFARALILLSAFAGCGIVACLTTMKEASNLEKWLMGIFGGLCSLGIPWLVERYQNVLVDLLREMKTKFPSVENLLFSFAYVAVCFGFVKLSEFVEMNEWTWVAVVFYCLCYIYVTSLMKVLGKSDVFGTGDALITISCMLMVKLHKDGKVNTLSLIGYLFGAVLLVLFRMGKQKKDKDVKKE